MIESLYNKIEISLGSKIEYKQISEFLEITTSFKPTRWLLKVQDTNLVIFANEKIKNIRLWNKSIAWYY